MGERGFFVSRAVRTCMYSRHGMNYPPLDYIAVASDEHHMLAACVFERTTGLEGPLLGCDPSPDRWRKSLQGSDRALSQLLNLFRLPQVRLDAMDARNEACDVDPMSNRPGCPNCFGCLDGGRDRAVHIEEQAPRCAPGKPVYQGGLLPVAGPVMGALTSTPRSVYERRKTARPSPIEFAADCPSALSANSVRGHWWSRAFKMH
jgi:hypothetical protein